jgi:hypothetical protein
MNDEPTPRPRLERGTPCYQRPERGTRQHPKRDARPERVRLARPKFVPGHAIERMRLWRGLPFTTRSQAVITGDKLVRSAANCLSEGLRCSNWEPVYWSLPETFVTDEMH